MIILYSIYGLQKLVRAIFRIILSPYQPFYSHFQVWNFVILWNLAYVILGLLRAQITNVLCARYNIQILWGFNVIILSQFQCFLKWYEINHSIHSYIICFICEINVLLFNNQVMKYKYGRYMTARTLMHFLESWWKMKEATVFSCPLIAIIRSCFALKYSFYDVCVPSIY